jgi:hypothetical protein
LLLLLWLRRLLCIVRALCKQKALSHTRAGGCDTIDSASCMWHLPVIMVLLASWLLHGLQLLAVVASCSRQMDAVQDWLT